MLIQTPEEIADAKWREAEAARKPTARAAKRVYLKAVRKLRAAIAAGKLTPKEGKAMRESWHSGTEIPKEYLD